jgi:hypothetical protein
VIVMATCIVSLSNSSKHDGDGGGSGGAWLNGVLVNFLGVRIWLASVAAFRHESLLD